MHPYAEAIRITGNTGNNAFSFEKRAHPELVVPSLIEGDLSDVKIGQTITFEDFDEHGDLKSCKGLENFVRFKHPKTKVPIVVVDNHNHVFYFWYEAWKKGVIERGATLVHIDQHKDMRKPKEGLQNADNLDAVFRYTNDVLNVGNYIPPAMEEGLIGKLISITSEEGLKEKLPGKFSWKSLIVNIDLDFWAPEMDYIDRKLKTEVTRWWIKRADLITIATSPFFIEQERAIEVLHELM